MTSLPLVSVILGTRPEAIKLAPVIQALRASPHLRTEVILTGQHREMVDQVMRLFGLRADRDLEIMRPRQSLTDITEATLRGLEPYLQAQRPQLVLVQGDTTTAFAAALAAFYQRIPVGHVEAGLRTDDLYHPFPEEANRRLISQLASLHFAPTPQAVDNLKQSRVIGSIYCTGNTVIDALLQVAALGIPCPIPGLDWGRYRVLLVTVHRRENWGDPLIAIGQALLQILAEFPDTALLLPLHPNPAVREPLQALLGSRERVFLTEPLDYPCWVSAMQRCTLILSDSGGIQEEAPALGKPVLVLRQTTERPEAIAAGTARLVGAHPEKILEAARELLTDPQAYARMAQAQNPFGDGTAARQICHIIERQFNSPSSPE
ncbi:UDP-N-acetylglucosamine 2-epimerase (non-hydrolyzing) [Thermostichus sp. MS-CIW-21]|jgi:UDP-N-acetylglucosamine 2-epimerase (non-hydrolysing)|uniref:non-hydrolyzing UDP-N-acetylglucosamine 2-epimerase n=3 Tax=Synechococcus TaxID=1129 RepID=UPI0000693F0F|nr:MULTISPECIES: UDP-N-acetylglucosamine 2-epimerase (non-hydrolyzing) [unclassified Synechococcus]ABC98336.1 UDP-N-acetylglucosamine 2-epimerase [Synechococcus sp. JA-3-3Ab]PIK86147.1 UDP-N-acetylglucosamine 2-epimerase [Synechococcus sp. 63AY4M2]PIK89388.1 UDP-N-acetylglucosamine 2-epimerase [Synechococcus sp. 65AY6A5]PIK91504.1 UDP-N-acetylglucosamine 2-epimerase [Synechococcus sp. 65AY6Li]PIK95214.1 UDP-N-acetylglucosamine 2-epimerase [Synechococcus sp. 60AY4M2]